jgi:hypothetical protein
MSDKGAQALELQGVIGFNGAARSAGYSPSVHCVRFAESHSRTTAPAPRPPP